ncbi:MAG: hypothetical protein D6731_03565 [Planctomycetota bacterium]|nr:MAG: hypothetical protein D6731_03565 [Planctomycetota bacterium]
MVRARCSDPAEPWALAHGILVFGAEFRVEGRPAVDVLVERWVRRDAAGRLGFPRGEAGRPVEPHPGLFTKTLLEVGVPLGHRFRAPDGSRFTLAELARDQAAAYAPGGTPPFHNQAWLLEVLAGTQDPRAGQLGDEALAVLAENQAYFEAYRDPTRPYQKPFVRRGSRREPAHIHRYYCGGLHLFQAVQRLHGGSCPPKLAHQYELLLLRLERETGYWKDALATARRRAHGAALARHERVILSQSLKLQGHALETYARAARAGVLRPSAEDRAALDRGARALERTVEAIESAGLYARLDALRRSEPQTYLDLVGDSAHALHALRLLRALQPSAR